MDILDVMKLAHDRAVSRLRELHTRVEEEEAAAEEVALGVSDALFARDDDARHRARWGVAS